MSLVAVPDEFSKLFDKWGESRTGLGWLSCEERGRGIAWDAFGAQRGGQEQLADSVEWGGCSRNNLLRVGIDSNIP